MKTLFRTSTSLRFDNCFCSEIEFSVNHLQISDFIEDLNGVFAYFLDLKNLQLTVLRGTNLPKTMENLDFRFENSRVKIIANKNYPQIRLAGLSFGPLQEGNEYEIFNWIARELVQAGIVHLREEDNLDATKLYKVQWKERVQVAGQISELPDNFYPKLRAYLSELKTGISIQPGKIQEYEKANSLAWDIVNSRLRKIVKLSSGPTQGEQIIQKLTEEEKLLYLELGKIVSNWRNKIIEH